jgi:hypothetical protein
MVLAVTPLVPPRTMSRRKPKGVPESADLTGAADAALIDVTIAI